MPSLYHYALFACDVLGNRYELDVITCRCVPTSVTHRDRSIHIERAIFLISDIFWPDWAIFESYWKQIFLIKEDQIFVWHLALFWKIHFVVKPSLAWYYSNIWSHLFQCLERLSGAKYSGQLILFI